MSDTEKRLQDEQAEQTAAAIQLEEEKLKEKLEWRRYTRIGMVAFMTFACCILFFFVLLRYRGFTDAWKQFISAGQPIIMGLVLAYLLNPVMKFCEKPIYDFLKKRMKQESKAKKAARGIAVGCAILFLLLIIGFLIAAIVPAVISSVGSLIETLPSQVQSFVTLMENGIWGDTELTETISVILTSVTDYVEKWAQETLLPQAQAYITQITSGVISVVKGFLNFIIGIIVAVYVMMIQETLAGQSKKVIYAVFKPKHGNVIIHTVRKSSEIFGGFISGKILDSAIIGVICYIGCLILRMPYAILIAVIIGVTNIIPFFGPIIGAVPCLLLVVIQSPLHALYLLIFVIVLQQVDGNIIGPKILGDSTGLSSFWVMFAILVAGGVWGFLGMLLGVPVFAVIYYIVSHLVRTGLRRRNLPDLTAEYITARGVDVETNTLRYAQPTAETKETVKDDSEENK